MNRLLSKVLKFSSCIHCKSIPLNAVKGLFHMSNKVKCSKKKKTHFENWATMPHLLLNVFKLSWVKQRFSILFPVAAQTQYLFEIECHVLSIVYHFNVFFLLWNLLVVQTCLFAFATYYNHFFCKSKRYGMSIMPTESQNDSA